MEILSETPSYHPFMTMIQTTLPMTIVTQTIESTLVIIFLVAISNTRKLKDNAINIPDTAL